MKKLILLPMAMTALTIAGCHNSPADRLADNVERAADNRADAMQNDAAMLRQQADALANQAHQVRDTADSRADAIRAADQNTAAMSPEQRAAIIANQAPAVR